MNTLQLSRRRAIPNGQRTRPNSDRMITDIDRCRLGTLVLNRLNRVWGTAQRMCKLEAILEDAQSVAAAQAPKNLVTMNTTVELSDIDTDSSRLVTVVYPQNADDAPDSISVAEPLGLALIGCRVGDVLQCPDEVGHDLRIAAIVSGPARSGTHRL